MNTIDYPLWRALQEIKDLQPGEILYIQRPPRASGEQIIISLYRPLDEVDNSSREE